MVDNRKMSHPAGNAVTLRHLLERGYTGRQVRLYLISTHYRQPLHFSFQALDSACASLKRLDEFVRNLRWMPEGPGTQETAALVSEFETNFREAIYDDLNVSAALTALFNLVRRVNRPLAQGRIGGESAQNILRALEKADHVLAVMPPEETALHDREIEDLIRARENARQAQDYGTADRLRADLETRGVVVKDTPQGPHWHWG
jgi:cysteinyl-tRNA synthetase